jgi:hypothetical protein
MDTRWGGVFTNISFGSLWTICTQHYSGLNAAVGVGAVFYGPRSRSGIWLIDQ